MRDLADGQAVDAVFLVRERKLAKKRNGEDFLRLTSPTTGSCRRSAGKTPATLTTSPSPAPPCGSGPLRGLERYGPQLTVERSRRSPTGDYELTDLLDGPRDGRRADGGRPARS